MTLPGLRYYGGYGNYGYGGYGYGGGYGGYGYGAGYGGYGYGRGLGFGHGLGYLPFGGHLNAGYANTCQCQQQQPATPAASAPVSSRQVHQSVLYPFSKLMYF